MEENVSSSELIHYNENGIKTHSRQKTWISMDQQDLTMAIITCMVDVKESSTNNIHHSYEHNSLQTHKDGATNSFTKIAPNFYGFQSAQP